LVKGADFDKSSKSTIIRGYHAFSGLDDSLSTYLRFTNGYYFAPFQVFKELLKQAQTQKFQNH